MQYLIQKDAAIFGSSCVIKSEMIKLQQIFIIFFYISFSSF